jgi:hypothetical protein
MKRLADIFKNAKFLYFPKYEKKNLVFYGLIVLAFIRPLGFIFHSPEIDGIGAATCISPLPTVFSKPGGIEAFTSQFYIVYPKGQFQTDTVLMSSKMFDKINGPHPFRNAVSLSFGYFALLPPSTAHSVLHYLFFEKKVLQDMGIPMCEQYTLINRNWSGGDRKEWVINVGSYEK